MSQSVKVRVSELIAILEATKAKEIAEHAKEKKGYEAKREKLRSAVIAALETEADRIAQPGTELPSTSYRNLRSNYLLVPFGQEVPNVPTTEPNTSRIDKDLRLLKHAADEFILVRSDSDWARYL